MFNLQERMDTLAEYNGSLSEAVTDFDKGKKLPGIRYRPGEDEYDRSIRLGLNVPLRDTVKAKLKKSAGGIDKLKSLASKTKQSAKILAEILSMIKKDSIGSVYGGTRITELAQDASNSAVDLDQAVKISMKMLTKSK